MAIIGELKTLFTGDTGPLKKSSGQARDELGRFVKSSDRASMSLGGFQSSILATAGKLTALIGVGKLFHRSFTLAADAETTALQFEILAKSAVKGQKAIEGIRKFAAATPFQTQDLTKAGKALLGFQVSTDNLLPRLRLLGDLAAATGANIGELASIFGKMKSSGVVSLGDINQLGDRAIPIFAALKKELGFEGDGAGAQLRKFISTSQLTFPTVLRALKSITAAGGQAHKATERLAETTAGKLSTLKDNFDKLLAEVGTELLKGLDMKKVIDGLTTFTQHIKKDLIPLLKESFGLIGQMAKGLKSVGVQAAVPVPGLGVGVKMKKSGFQVQRETEELVTKLAKNEIGGLGLGQFGGMAADAIGRAKGADLGSLFAVVRKPLEFMTKAHEESVAKEVAARKRATMAIEKGRPLLENMFGRGMFRASTTAGEFLGGLSNRLGGAAAPLVNMFRGSGGGPGATPFGPMMANTGVMAGSAEAVRIAAIAKGGGAQASIQQQALEEQKESTNLLQLIANAVTAGGGAAFDTTGVF